MRGECTAAILRRALSGACAGLLLLAHAAGAACMNPVQLEGVLRSELERARAQLKFPGATSAFVLPGGRSGSVAVGFADLERQLPMRPENRMPAGSIGKTFAAALALALVEEGKLSLDDKLSRWLGSEDWYGRLANGADIRVRDLLNHGAGIGEHVESKGFGALVQERIAGNPDEPIEPLTLVGFVLDQPPLFAPGHGYKYTDTAYILLQLAVEKAGGVRLWDGVVRRFLYPLQLNSTSPAVGRLHAGLAQGYVSGKLLAGLPATTLEDGVFRWNPVSEWAGGGFISNSRDLARWARALYEGRTSPAGIGAKMVAAGNLNTASEGYTYGLGVVIRQSPRGPVWGHGGVYPGYRSNMAYFVNRKTAIAVQVNTDGIDGASMGRDGQYAGRSRARSFPMRCRSRLAAEVSSCARRTRPSSPVRSRVRYTCLACRRTCR